MKETIVAIKDFVSGWLSFIDLTLSPTKTRLVFSTEGFNFRGFHFTHVGKKKKLKTRITPSKESCKNLLENIRKKT